MSNLGRRENFQNTEEMFALWSRQTGACKTGVKKSITPQQWYQATDVRPRPLSGVFTNQCKYNQAWGHSGWHQVPLPQTAAAWLSAGITAASGHYQNQEKYQRKSCFLHERPPSCTFGNTSVTVLIVVFLVVYTKLNVVLILLWYGWYVPCRSSSAWTAARSSAAAAGSLKPEPPFPFSPLWDKEGNRFRNHSYAKMFHLSAEKRVY